MKRRLTLGMLLAGAASAPVTVAAQTVTPAGPAAEATVATPPAAAGTTGQADAPAAAPATSTPDDIVVTAQRRPERLQNVPLSVTAVSGDTLKTRALNDLAQVSLAAPSLQITADNNFAVRGVGTGSFSASIESSVAFALDEVNLTNSGLNSDFFDVAQVEVLNGPQGLLFGRNASAGLLNVTTVRPELGKLGAAFDLQADHRDTAPGNSNGVITRASINIPVGEDAAFRVSSLYSYQQPLTRFRGPLNGRNDLGQRRYGFRGKFLYEPDSRLSIYVIGDYGNEKGVLGLYDTTYRQLGTGSILTAPLAAVGVTAGTENADIAGDAGFFSDTERRGLQAKVSYTLDNGLEISNIAAWKSFDRRAQIDQDGTALNGANVNTQQISFDQYSNEFRVALPQGERLSGQAGLYYFHSDLNSRSQIGGNNFIPDAVARGFPFCVAAAAVPGAAPPTCSTSNLSFLGNDRVVGQKNDSYAAFGQFTFKVTEQLQLLAGGRVTRDELSIDLTQNTGRYFIVLGIPFSGSQTFDNTNFSWKVGGQYNITPDAMIYATYGRGYKGPGFNDNAVTPTASLAVRPETNYNLEVGAKTSWLNRALVFNVSAFRSRFRDYQSQSLDLNTSSFIIQNAARVNTQGVEVSAIVRPVAGLTLNGSATFLDAEFGDFPGAQCFPTQGCATFNARGRRLPLAPTFTGTVQGVYEIQTGGDVRPFVEVNYYHRSAISYNIAPAPGSTYRSADVLGASLGVRSDNWRASLFCKNCTDRRVPFVIGVDPLDSFAGVTSYAQRFGLNSYRTIGLLLGLNF